MLGCDIVDMCGNGFLLVCVFECDAEPEPVGGEDGSLMPVANPFDCPDDVFDSVDDEDEWNWLQCFEC